MGFDLYGMNAKSKEKGDYFRANVWWWRPLWQYVTVACDDILTGRDMERGEYNDGHKISKTKANRIASRLKKLDKNGSIMKYESEYKTYLRSLPKVDCNICEGTGVREDEIGREARKEDEEYKCNGCLGEGKRDNFNTSYPFESEEVIRFAEFCEHSGGFEIC